jgi:hypothetical protein
LLHDATPKLLKRLGGGIQPIKLTPETLPAVEDVPLPAPVVTTEPLPPESLKRGDAGDQSL